VDPSLGAAALQNARDLIGDADRVAVANDAIFGTTGEPVNVIVFALDGKTDGTGGADHMGCDHTTGADIEVCASFGNAVCVSALFEAELSECSKGGRLCGLSTGEALSRWCAAVIGKSRPDRFPSLIHCGICGTAGTFLRAFPQAKLPIFGCRGDHLGRTAGPCGRRALVAEPERAAASRRLLRSYRSFRRCRETLSAPRQVAYA